MLKKFLFFFVSLTVGITLFIGVINFVGFQEIKSAFTLFTGWHGLVILILTGLLFFIGIWKWKLILKNQGYDLSNKELSGPFLAGFALTYLFPIFIAGGTGTIFKGYILKEKFSIPWRKGIVSLIIDRFLETTISLLLVLAGLALFLLKIGFPPGNAGIFLLAGAIIFTALIGFIYFKFFRSESIVNLFARFFSKNRFVNGTAREIEKDIFEFFKLKKSIFWKVAGLAFMKMVIMGLRGWILLLFLGKMVDPLVAIIILTFYYLALFIPVPAMLGTHEITQAFAFSALGIGIGLAPAFTMVQRGAEMVLALIGLAIFFKLGISLIQTFLFKKTERLLR